MAFRAELSPESTTFLPLLKSVFQKLKFSENNYASVYFERKLTKKVNATFKDTSSSSEFVQGAVLRIYDGYTLYEQGCDDLSPEGLNAAALNLKNRVLNAPSKAGLKFRPYLGASWAQRKETALDPHIASQIPENPKHDEWVHFGIQGHVDPRAHWSFESRISEVQSLLKKVKDLSIKEGFQENELSYANCTDMFRDEESMFIDNDVCMSQANTRLMTRLIMMCGEDYHHIGKGGLGGIEMLKISDDEILESLHELKSLKTAEKLVPGKYRLLCGPVVSGVLAHEAFGHSQEADTCARGRSKAWELFQSQTKVGNHHATILNNPAVFKNGVEEGAAWGSYFFDEEGWLSSSHIILDKGRLTSPMTNLTSALRLGVNRTANGKRENWTHGVYSRQTNTYFSAGLKTYNELLESMGDGFCATEVSGGMEDPKGMGIQVGLQYLKEVKNGKFTGKVFRGPAGGEIQMTGYVPDLLNSILDKSKVDHENSHPDSVEHPFNDVGGCGKYHKEFVYAGCGGPYLLLDNVTLG